jgi:hypothetical protein
MALADLVVRLGRALIGAVTPSAGAAPSAPALGPLGQMLSLIPVADLVALFEGRGTVDTDLDLAARAAKLVALAFPPGAMAAGDVALALEALRYVLDAAGVGPTPIHIEGGVPDAFPPGGGPGTYRGR